MDASEDRLSGLEPERRQIRKRAFRIEIIAGARPNFMKIAPIIHELHKSHNHAISYRLIHTGQHYDPLLSSTFFEQLNIPAPHLHLKASGGTQAEITSSIMIAYERALALQPRPNLCLVVGDVTSTMACSIVAKKANIQVAHVEAGIRSGDWTMPEEINRVVTDAVSDYFFTTSAYANTNLQNAGVSPDRIFFVGNTMIDTLLQNLPRISQPTFWQDYQLKYKGYLVLTLHRPSNVDDVSSLQPLLTT